MKAMQAATTDQFYNVGSGVKTTIKELAELLLQLTRAGTGMQYEPGGMTLVKNRVGSPVKAERELGFATHVELRDGLRNLIEWRSVHRAGDQQLRSKRGGYEAPGVSA
ncbi:MAG: hypothetical protein M5U08_01010 [Burkholderiales bacterium]|nr:hypothetical protein [Burkholderiales bacterium]